ncbi:MAG: M20 aminoacylase family protein [Clostridiaceae bacterium]|nr:M20 aminoacylase family protein [Clostridiaceae bacterium]
MRDLKLLNQLIDWRRYLHENPETAFEEVNTAKFVSEKLVEMGYEVETGIGKTGLVASLKSGDGSGVIGLRADMDAINMQEKGEFPYASRNSGKMHACGHDGHTVTLLGTAKLLAERKNFNGTVRLVFQPAEEPGKGAQAMIDDGLFTRFPVDEIYGLHNAPFLPEGAIHTRPEGIMASEDNFVIRIKGKGSHASSPHVGVDPLVTASQIILGLQTIVSRNVSPLQQAVVSCTELHTDGVHNAIPSNVAILGDTRSFSTDVQELIETRMRSISENICNMNGAGCEFLYTHEFSPTVNWERCVNAAAKAAINVVGEDKVNTNCEPWTASEDFGTFLRHVPGCFLFLGSGKSTKASENTPLHNSQYDYNDDILEIGAEFFAELIRLRLPQSN